MEGTSNIDVHEVIEILGERVLNVAVEEDTSRINENVKATQFLDNREGHLILLHIYAQITLDNCGLRGVLPPN